MNIQVQCCGVVILIMLWFFYLKHKPLGLYSVKLFLITMAATSFCISMDIISIVAINYQERISGFLLAFICKTYLVSLVWVGCFELIYSCIDFVKTSDVQKRRGWLFASVAAVGSVIIYVLPIKYYLDGSEVYTYGPSCMATYAFALLFIIMTFSQVTIKGKEMNTKRRIAVITWITFWIAAALIQFCNARLLLVGFASVLGITILFFELENPEANLDGETSAYNAHALGAYMNQLFDRKEKFSVILLALTDEGARYNEDQFDGRSGIIREIADYLKKIKDIYVFKTLESELVLIFENEERMQEVFLMIQNRFTLPWNNRKNGEHVLLNPYYVVLQNSDIIRNTEEAFQILRYFRVEERNSEKHIILLDDKKILKLHENEQIKMMISSAIADDRIEVFYQPIYSTRKHAFTSAEALVRIREKDGSVIMPGRFIPTAEKIGLIAQIGDIVFEKTCSFIKENQLKERYGVDYVEINLSVKQCEKRNFAEKYISIMKKYDVDPSCINLEITESASIQTRHIFMENVQTLIDFGVSFSLDDFGSGESNLNYIIDMPVSIVKFDRGMSQAYFADQKAKFVMEAAMHMIRDMKLKIVSEGVETKEQMETIVALGIDYIQGYYFSKPLSGEQFLQFVSGYKEEQQ